jgi:hypothetical protein
MGEQFEVEEYAHNEDAVSADGGGGGVGGGRGREAHAGLPQLHIREKDTGGGVQGVE